MPSFFYSQGKPTNCIYWLIPYGCATSYCMLEAELFLQTLSPFIFNYKNCISSLSAYNAVSANLYHNHENWGVIHLLSYTWILYTGRCTNCGDCWHHSLARKEKSINPSRESKRATSTELSWLQYLVQTPWYPTLIVLTHQFTHSSEMNSPCLQSATWQICQ
jgi:hypothetical protein